MSICNGESDNVNSKLPVCIRNLTVKYGENIAIKNVSFEIKEGEYLGVIGPNGGGKTTLLRSILGLTPVTAGEVYIYGEKPKKTDRLIGYVPQITAVDKLFPITVREVVLSGRLKSKISLFHKYCKEDLEKTEQALEAVGIVHLKNRMISDLSGGEFQKMLIARALAVEPKLMLLDEPTASVDAQSRDAIFSLLNRLNQKMTIVLVTHDLMAVSSHVKELACINGKLVYHGIAEINEEIVQNLYNCPVDLIAHGVPHRVLKEHKG